MKNTTACLGLSFLDVARQRFYEYAGLTGSQIDLNTYNHKVYPEKRN